MKKKIINFLKRHPRVDVVISLIVMTPTMPFMIFIAGWKELDVDKAYKEAFQTLFSKKTS